MPITPDTFKPYGDFDYDYDDNPVEAETIMTAEVDGVRYLTDRHLMIRADLVAPQPDPDHMFKMTPGAGESVANFVEMILKAEPLPEPDMKKKLAPVYVADFEGTGLALVPSARVWLIQQDGVTVGCIAPLQPRGGFDGILPGEIRPEHRAAEKALAGHMADRWWRWVAAFQVVDAVKAAA